MIDRPCGVRLSGSIFNYQGRMAGLPGAGKDKRVPRQRLHVSQIASNAAGRMEKILDILAGMVSMGS